MSKSTSLPHIVRYKFKGNSFIIKSYCISIQFQISADINCYVPGSLMVRAPTNSKLTIAGERDITENGKTVRNLITRSINLPRPVVLKRTVTAVSADGILTIFAPRM